VALRLSVIRLAIGVGASTALAFVPCDAQFAPVRIASNVERQSTVADDTPIELQLSRPLSASEGEFVVVVGGTDVTAVTERVASRVVYRPSAMPLPSGETQVVVYARNGGVWHELRRFTMHVVQAAQGSQSSTEKSATVGNTGQLAEGRSAAVPAPNRRTFQDFVLNGGLRSSQRWTQWALTTQSNYVGVSRREQALEFATRGDKAPMIDLSDYQVGVQGPDVSLLVGHVTFGASRHLVNGFASRGTTFSLTRGATSLSLAALNGSAQLGWNDLVGLDRPSNRMFVASLGREIVPSHPGVVRFDVTMLGGSKLPATSFTQGAVVDAERSQGVSVQMSAASPNQRLHLAAGYTHSRFDNPASDPQLLADTLTKRPRPAASGARFVEANAAIFQNVQIPILGSAALSVAARDERVDPLFRSIASVAAADRQQDGADASLSLGSIAAQLSQGWTHDNLGRVAAGLRTDGRTTTANIAVPMATFAGPRRYSPLLPTLTLAYNRTHQFADGMPVNGAFRPSDLPDQVSENGDLGLQWLVGTIRVSAHVNQTAQDNRQPDREAADFASGVRGLSIGAPLGTSGDVSLDAGQEFQISKERAETTLVRRLTMNGSRRTTTSTSIVVSWSFVHTRPPAGLASTNMEQHVELSQEVSLCPGSIGGCHGQLFLRYGRSAAFLPDVSVTGIASPTRTNREQWTLASGLNLRFL
jgi:hypothetical protein